MADHYYMSLPGIGRWDVAIKETNAQWSPFRHYIDTAIQAAEQRAPILAWRLPTDDEKQALEQTQRRRTSQPSSPGKAMHRRDRKHRHATESKAEGSWIILEPRATVDEESDATFDAFLEALAIHERAPQRRGRELVWNPRSSIKVLERDDERLALRVERLPLRAAQSDPEAALQPLVYLKPNTWPLQCQAKALEQLQSRPSPRLAPLVRLASTRASWGALTPRVLAEDDWFFLKQQADGSLRDGTLEQRQFVARALATPDFAVLDGPPGSGKTTAIGELILQLAREGKRVLLVASTHVAVDNVLENLLTWQENSPTKPVMPLRIGDEDKVASEAVRPWTLKRLSRTCQGQILDFLDKPDTGTASGGSARALLGQALHDDSEQPSPMVRMMLEASNLVCATTIGILKHPDLKDGLRMEPFDFMILDEASKTTFSEFLVPAQLARRWAVVGDRRQLSPFVDETDLAENIARLLPHHAAVATAHAFAASDRPGNLYKGNALLAFDNEAQRQLLVEEARAREIPAVDLDNQYVTAPSMLLAGARLVCGSPDTLIAWEHRLPGDLRPGNDAVPPLPDWRAHSRADWRIRNRAAHRNEQEHELESLSWSDEVAWRQIRAYELRRNPPEARRYLNELNALLPKAPSMSKQAEALEKNLGTMRRVAMTSILEILQDGAGTFFDWEKDTVLTHGLPKHAQAQRSVSLKFQHRMHPDISAFPREQFYADDNLLHDARNVNRDWSYPHYSRRAVWLDIAPRATSSNGRQTGNASPAEVDALIKELGTFADWAERTPRSGDKAGTPWKVAALTFYKKQEYALRDRLRKLSGQRTNTRHFSLRNQRVEVTLCTVDRFQGHEADLVLLSFVKSGSAGFLNSPNRLNVALTRARYQLVLIGHRRWMASDRCRSDLLKKLGNSAHYAKDIAWDTP